jgi:hypothetical protein
MIFQSIQADNMNSVPAANTEALAAMASLMNEMSPTTPSDVMPKPAPLEVALTPDEIQILKEMVVVRSRQKTMEYVLPDKPVNKDDEDRFAESVLNRKTYSEKMILIPGKMEVVFRSKTRREQEAIEKQLDEDYANGAIKTERANAFALNNYNLMIQMVSQNGAAVQSPVSRLIDPTFSLRGFIESHIIGSMPEPIMFILSGALAQFENRVAFMSRKILEGNFSQPADAS